MSNFTDLQQAEPGGNEFRHFIFELVSALSGEKDCAKRIDSLLDAALEYYEADRAYVIEGDTELVTAVNTHERCAPGAEYQQDTLKDMPVEAYLRWLDIFQHSKDVVIEDMETLRESCPGEYKYFSDSDVRALIVVPFSKRINHGFPIHLPQFSLPQQIVGTDPHPFPPDIWDSNSIFRDLYISIHAGQ